MRTCILLLIICALIYQTLSFNIDLDSRVVYQKTSSQSEWFGFSVALHKSSTAQWILIGAPKAQTNQRDVERGGHVYKCNPYQSECTPVEFDKLGPKYEKDKNNVSRQSDTKSHQMFGATVISGGENRPVVACAPRYVYFSKSFTRFEPVGKCFVANTFLNYFEEYAPCRTSAWGYHNQGYCQAGFSAAISKNGLYLYIGAVGSWHWQGRIFSQSLVDEIPPIGTKQGSMDLDVSYLGYSTAAGEFNGDNFDDVVVSRPRGSNITGEVLIYDFELTKLNKLSNEDVGSYFGYSLAVLDINGDGRHDIIVGAPMFNFDSKDKSYDKGRVHFFYQTADHEFDRDFLDGYTNKGRFGTAIASLGDLNKDKFGDVAISAPYGGDDGNGAVYIYLGSADGIIKEPSQIIHAKDVNSNLKTFGFSLSGGMDMDSNGYPDLVVGSYGSDAAVFFKARPVVTILPEISVDPTNANLDDKLCKLRDRTPVSCLTIQVCLNYTGEGSFKSIDVIYDMVLDEEKDQSRVYFLQNERENSITIQKQIQKDNRSCDFHKVYINNDIYDKLNPLTVKVEPRLPTARRGKRQSSRSLRPVLDKNVQLVARKEINIYKDCGGDQKCVPDLKITVKSNVDVYVIRKNKRIEFEVEILNQGENAYDSNYFMEISDLMDFDRVNEEFSENCKGPGFSTSGVLKCYLGNPLEAKKKISFKVFTSPKVFFRKASDLSFNFIVNSSNPETNSTLADNSLKVVIPVKVDVNLTVSARTYPQTVIYNVSDYTSNRKMTKESNLGPEIIHTYIVRNTGPSRILEAEVVIIWPSYFLNSKPFMYLMRPPYVSQNVNCRGAEVNPKNLKLGLVASKIEEVFFTGQYENGNWTGLDGSKGRSKRETSPFSQENYEKEMICEDTICTLINCTIKNLDNVEYIAIAGRLMVSTIKDHDLSKIGVQSKVVARVTKLPFQLDPSYLGYSEDYITTSVNSRSKPKERSPIPWWIIFLAICIGLILLVIVVLILWKFGFFERKRIVEQKSGRVKNGYHSPHSDDAYL